MTATCRIHGTSMRALGTRAYCPVCTAALTAPLLSVYEGNRAHLAQSELDARILVSGIPEIFRNASFESFDADGPRAAQVAQALRNYSVHFATQRARRSGFVLTGPTGVGKTHLACAMLHEVMAQGFSARYVSLPRLTFEVRRTYKSQDSQDTVANLIADLVNCDLLVLDEIDLHGSSDSDYQMLYEIINGRYEAGGKPTVALSNRSASDLAEDLHERVMSRILCGTSPIACNWSDRRSSRRKTNETTSSACKA